MSSPPPMIKDVEEVIDRMGLRIRSNLIGNKDFSVSATSNMVPTDFIDPEICTKFGIETMADLLDFMESIEDGEDDGVTSYRLIPVESEKFFKENMELDGVSVLDSAQQKGKFWCSKDIKFVHLEKCIVCKPFFGGYSKITCVLTCNYKFSM